MTSAMTSANIDTLAPMAARLRHAVLGMSPREASFARRGFPAGEPRVVAHLERIGEVFLAGYNAAVSAGTPDGLVQRLAPVPVSHLGFAMEGAGMGFMLLDRLMPARRGRFQRFLDGDAADHSYMAHVGAGWALARLQRAPFASPLDGVIAPMHAVLRWLVIDGYGFHEGYFRPHRAAARPRVPMRHGAYADRAYDQGLGRSLWFSACADPGRISLAIGRMAASRHGDLWSGVGLACTYAGGVSDATIAAVARYGAEHAADIAQGAAFAAAARLRAGLLVEHTTRACRILCRLEPEEAAAVAEACMVDLDDSPLVPAFEAWRRRIADHFRARARRPLSIA
jgi:enediyne biosynthesis protein E3